MYRLSLLSIVLLLAACGSSRPDRSDDGPDTPEGPSRIEVQLDSLTARLDLDEDQRESVRRALAQEAAALRAARGLPDLQSRRGAALQARAEAGARIAASLTRAQREAYDAYRAEQEVGGFDPSVERQLARLRARLDLTSDQEDAIASILERQVIEIEALVADYLRRGGRDVDDARGEIQEIRERYDTLIVVELTPEQAETYERLVADERRPRARRR